MTDRELMQQALEAMDGWNHVLDPKPDANLITALRERLAQPEQEPVARVNDDGFIVETGLLISPGQLLYTGPQPAPHPDCNHEERIPMLACVNCGALVGTQPEDDIIKLARMAGCHDNGEEFRFVEFRYLERFVALVAAAERERIKQKNAPVIERVNAHIKALEDAVTDEREACAKMCDELAARDKLSNYYAVAAKAIRARGNL